MSRTGVGQPQEACPELDKWGLLTRLTEAAESFGLNHRTLTVLRALLSFFPERTLPRDAGQAVVFPSNATLSQRLNGMPESTLRRHLATLVRSGIVSRQDSPNRKRYARRHGLAYGFDLSPLARAAERLAQAASDIREARDRRNALRDRLALVRARLLASGTVSEDDPAMETARLMLRRKTDGHTLQTLLDQLEPLLTTPVPIPSEATKTSASDNRNERHIQIIEKDSAVQATQAGKPMQDIALRTVLEHCREYKSYYPDTPSTWHGLLGVTDRMHPMLGIGRPLYEKAMRVLGPTNAAATVLSLLERFNAIRNPAAYLCGLIERARLGQLDLRALVIGSRGHKLSADNLA